MRNGVLAVLLGMCAGCQSGQYERTCRGMGRDLIEAPASPEDGAAAEAAYRAHVIWMQQVELLKKASEKSN